MQTFMPYKNPKMTAQVLDNKRLGKQRVECIQIANYLLGVSPNSSWRNHPAVKMWRGYETYLIKVYLREIMDEWIRRGFKNTKCEKHYNNFCRLIGNTIRRPLWITDSFCFSHRSNLIRKLPEYYRQFWPATPDNLNYIWPIKEEEQYNANN